jgi:hypothetical protein
LNLVNQISNHRTLVCPSAEQLCDVAAYWLAAPSTCFRDLTSLALRGLPSPHLRKDSSAWLNIFASEEEEPSTRPALQVTTSKEGASAIERRTWTRPGRFTRLATFLSAESAASSHRQHAQSGPLRVCGSFQR